jgi:hypothetical protein
MSKPRARSPITGKYAERNMTDDQVARELVMKFREGIAQIDKPQGWFDAIRWRKPEKQLHPAQVLEARYKLKEHDDAQSDLIRHSNSDAAAYRYELERKHKLEDEIKRLDAIDKHNRETSWLAKLPNLIPDSKINALMKSVADWKDKTVTPSRWNPVEEGGVLEDLKDLASEEARLARMIEEKKRIDKLHARARPPGYISPPDRARSRSPSKGGKSRRFKRSNRVKSRRSKRVNRSLTKRRKH